MNLHRVAFFTDSFHEVNGVALTSRQFHAFAQRTKRPLLCVAAARPGSEPQDSESLCELPAGRFFLSLERDLRFDLGFLRHRARILGALERFQPTLIHVTSPGHVGILGLLAARHLRLPLVASWHTNVHEFGARRLAKLLRFLPCRVRSAVCRRVQDSSLWLILKFYSRARLTFAPNTELTEMLRRGTGRPSLLMERGIDTAMFRPSRRKRQNASTLVIGYVGRLSPEKNVRALVRLESDLRAAGARDYRFLIVGGGSEREWLQANLKQADLPGVLTGEPLAEAYASMDVFAFPSETDTFGNVVLEAMASGAPPVVMDSGGPKFLVRTGETGFVVSSPSAFSRVITSLYFDRRPLSRIGAAARRSAEIRSWDAVFENVYQAYSECFPAPKNLSAYCNPPVIPVKA